ncbi:hypothetical protein BXZ70DRAFT_1039298 [Cristinia sonorae]|uniref:F-box domain-containing protein n=1 Tax=Cristinia sonorae TaxID=1940300 RepID=A0A8K0XM57_9AGAR|nr:hypothetical protein BXZ70DRAFT_1039298 [Cristinia sonorae]
MSLVEIFQSIKSLSGALATIAQAGRPDPTPTIHQILDARKDLLTVINQLSALHNRFIPIHKLPTEILVHIFEYLLQDGRRCSLNGLYRFEEHPSLRWVPTAPLINAEWSTHRNWVSFRQVCQRWRLILQATPSLANTIIIDDTRGHDNDTLRLLLHSATAPLEIHIAALESRSWDILRHAMPRVQILRAHCYKTSRDVTLLTEDSVAPLLEEVDITVDQNNFQLHDTFFQVVKLPDPDSVPRLRQVIVHNILGWNHKYRGKKYSNLTHLCIIGAAHEYCGIGLAMVLQSVPRVEVLYLGKADGLLQNTQVRPPDDEKDNLEVVPLKSLREMRIAGLTLNHLLLTLLTRLALPRGLFMAVSNGTGYSLPASPFAFLPKDTSCLPSSEDITSLSLSYSETQDIMLSGPSGSFCHGLEPNLRTIDIFPDPSDHFVFPSQNLTELWLTDRKILRGYRSRNAHPQWSKLFLQLPAVQQLNIDFEVRSSTLVTDTLQWILTDGQSSEAAIPPMAVTSVIPLPSLQRLWIRGPARSIYYQCASLVTIMQKRRVLLDVHDRIEPVLTDLLIVINPRGEGYEEIEDLDDPDAAVPEGKMKDSQRRDGSEERGASGVDHSIDTVEQEKSPDEQSGTTRKPVIEAIRERLAEINGRRVVQDVVFADVFPSDAPKPPERDFVRRGRTDWYYSF